MTLSLGKNCTEGIWQCLEIFFVVTIKVRAFLLSPDNTGKNLTVPMTKVYQIYSVSTIKVAKPHTHTYTHMCVYLYICIFLVREVLFLFTQILENQGHHIIDYIYFSYFEL